MDQKTESKKQRCQSNGFLNTCGLGLSPCKALLDCVISEHLFLEKSQCELCGGSSLPLLEGPRERERPCLPLF